MNGVPSCEGEGVYTVTSPLGIDPFSIGKYAEVLEYDAHTAVVRMPVERAGALAAEGYELKAMLPPLPRAESGPRERRAPRVSDETVRDLINRFDGAGYWARIGELSGETGVSIGGEPYRILTRYSLAPVPIARATEFCHDYFQSLGLEAHYEEYPLGASTLRNVVAEQRGTVHPDQVYILCAHLDDVPPGLLAPGADDNASGSAAVLTAAALLRGYSFESTVRYVLFTGEEQGLFGSYHYVQGLVTSGTAVQGTINMDMIAYDSNGDGVVEIDCGTMDASSFIGDTMVDTISRYGLPLAPYKVTVSSTEDSDHARF
ncbi:MAG: M28 family peptidase, partial [Candidatus Aureabacteria bacterium]|nr:M28 family peptidase [Candidatus Auribacterota bacterium]